MELTANGMELYYYSTENSSAEIDFIVQKNESIIPIEVKADENPLAEQGKTCIIKEEMKE